MNIRTPAWRGLDTELSHYARRFQAIEALLIERGVCTPDELQLILDELELRTPYQPTARESLPARGPTQNPKHACWQTRRPQSLKLGISSPGMWSS